MKKLNEKQDYPKDWDFKGKLNYYGIEYLGEHDPDSQPMEMEMIDDMGYTPLEAIERAFHGVRFGFKNDPFNPNDSWVAFNGYANFVSIDDRYLNEYLEENIDESDFFEWCVDQGYTDSGEDEE